MRTLGYILVTLGFLCGALVGVLDKSQVRWDYFVPALALGTIGVVLLHLARRTARQTGDKLSSNIEFVLMSISRIVDSITRLDSQKTSIDTYDIRHRIDDLFPQDLSTFVDARHSIAHLYGLRAYADVMTSFAAGERYLNRVWSASADGYIDEAHTYLTKAKGQFTDASAKLLALRPAPHVT